MVAVASTMHLITEHLPERFPHHACVRATCERGQVSIPWKAHLAPEENHARAATALLRVLALSGAITEHGKRCFNGVYAYTFTPAEENTTHA